MERIDYFLLSPEVIKKMRDINHMLDQFTLDVKIRALVEVRVSQINGCAYCVDLHMNELRNLGEMQQRMDTLAVWRDSPFFDESEKAALAWAESLTKIAQTHAEDSDYHPLKLYFSDLEIVELSISISTANFWNRMAGGFKRLPTKRI